MRAAWLYETDTVAMQVKSNTPAYSRNPMSREQFWFFHPFRVRYSEIDGQGVVFNAHYLTYFDTTITEYFRALGYDQYADAERRARISTSSNRSSNTRRRSGSTRKWMSVRAVARIGNSSLTFELAIFLKGGMRRS